MNKFAGLPTLTCRLHAFSQSKIFQARLYAISRKTHKSIIRVMTGLVAHFSVEMPRAVSFVSPQRGMATSKETSIVHKLLAPYYATRIGAYFSQHTFRNWTKLENPLFYSLNVNQPIFEPRHCMNCSSTTTRDSCRKSNDLPL